jgi:UDP-N-acetylmuramate--alanine ligase
MNQLSQLKSVYFLGIGGIGMSALARYFNQRGVRVSGYDKTSTALTDSLSKEGIEIVFEDAVELVPKDVDLVVYTPAIPKDHKGFNYYKSGSYNLLKRSEVLGLISAEHYTVAVAGSHGKTTVSSMIAHIICNAGYDVEAFLGGICSNYYSNYITQSGMQFVPAAKDKVVIVEADEFDRSFHRLHPNLAVITAVDTDHLDIYGSKQAIDEAFIQFAEKIEEEGFLAIKNNQSINDKLPQLDKAFYAFADNTADVFCSKYWIVEGGYLFHISYFGKEYKSFRLNLGGLHNIENAIAAFIVCLELGLNAEQIKAGLNTFKGIKRRFEKLIEDDKHVFIDDYAHHPEEIRMLLSSVKELYPEKRIAAVFQPHLFSRTKDLAEGFAKSLSIADEVVLLEIYPARELPIEGVTSDLIFNQLTCQSKHSINKTELVSFLNSKDDIEVLLTIGAGDIDKYLTEIKSSL